jgi:dihydroxyacid dehydratase/phosphogluconate dehydratase
MAAATVDIPAIVLSGGPMLDGWMDGELVGSGSVIWKARKLYAAGEIDKEKFLAMGAASAPSAGHCNTMGTASTMNAIAEALGMSLTGCSAIPAPYRERGQMAYETGKRIVQMAFEDLRPSQVLTRDAFLDAIVVNAAIGGSTNAQPHIMAMARHAGVELKSSDWMEFGHRVPLLANVQPAGKYLGERFHRAGGVPAIMWELQQAGLLRSKRATVTGQTMAANLEGKKSTDREVITPFAAPLKADAGFFVLSGNLFDFAIMKTSVISDEFRARYLSRPGFENIFESRAIVFDGSDDYHHRITDPALNIDEGCMLVIRGAGPVGWPGSAEVVNMQPPDALIRRGIQSLPTLGDGRQSGTSDSPSILNASPESAVGGGLAWLRTGDTIRVDLNAGRCDMLVADDEIARRKTEGLPPVPASQTPWQEIYRSTVGQLEQGACLELALPYQRIAEKLPRHNH